MSTQTKRDALNGEDAKLQTRFEKILAENRTINTRRNEIRAELSKLALIDLIGVPNAVKLLHREPRESKHEWLNDARGTIIEVKRTRVIAEFNGQKFSFHLGNIIPATDSIAAFVDSSALARTVSTLFTVSCATPADLAISSRTSTFAEIVAEFGDEFAGFGNQAVGIADFAAGRVSFEGEVSA